MRFGKDKLPYKTNIGIQFRYEMTKDVHAPGFYVYIEHGECFPDVGIWRPDSSSLGKIRDRIIEKPELWETVSNDKSFKKYFKMSGECLKRPPRGYDKEHPLIDDLKRKDFIAIMSIEDDKVLSLHLPKQLFIALMWQMSICDFFVVHWNFGIKNINYKKGEM